jgi:iron complex outermembrane recepter protein
VRAGIVIALCPAAAELAAAQTAPAPGTLPQIDVTAPRRKPARPAQAGTQTETQAEPAPAPAPASGDRSATTTPLNTETVTEVGSRLGLTPRQTPATVEIANQPLLQERGLRTTTEAAEAFVGVTAADAPGAPASFSMRGFTGTQINTLYNGIWIGPSEMTGRIMDTGTFQQIEVLKGPDALVSGVGGIGGTINYVTKKPHTGKVENETYASYDSWNGYRYGLGSGGSTPIKGLDYRFDVVRANNISFIDDSYSKLLNISGRLNYRPTADVLFWGAAERYVDKDRFYWGTPLVPVAFSGPFATSGVVSGLWTNYYPNGHTGMLSPVTIDSRTLRTTYNVLDNNSEAKQLWLRGGVEWDISNSAKFRSQFYSYRAHRHWFNNEINGFDNTPDVLQVYRERLSVDHDQDLLGNITDLTLNSRVAGMDNRFVAAFEASRLRFDVIQDDFFNNDFVNLVNPIRGLYGPQQTKPFFTDLDRVAISFDDRLKITPTFALIGGVRLEQLQLTRTAYDVAGMLRSEDGYPFNTTFKPVTGRVGYTWEALPGLTFYSQYATAADPVVANLFILRPTQPHLLTESRILETGVKHLFWDNRAEWTFAVFDIERNNVYSTKAGQVATVAGKIQSQGVELNGAVRPTREWQIWANLALVDAKYVSFIDDTGTSFAGKTPPNVPSIVANAGTSYRFPFRWPVEVGGLVRHVGSRFTQEDNLITMNAYTLVDAYVFVDIDPRDIAWYGVQKARVTFRVKNIADKIYAVWADPGYPDQIILGSPRRYEVAALFKF